MKRSVTFTGVDDRTSLDILKLLDDKNIEWGVLVSGNNTNKGTATRFPSFETIDRILNLGLNNVSCHICGNFARHYVKTGDFSQIRDFLTQERVEKFSRFQLNIRGYDRYKTFIIEEDIHIIIQVSDLKSYQYFYQMQKLNPNKVEALIDYSGGKGKLGCFNYVSNGNETLGYAGGINANNVTYISGYIEGRMEHNVKYWIDMESSVRTDDWFDLNKVSEVLSEIKRTEGIKEKLAKEQIDSQNSQVNDKPQEITLKLPCRTGDHIYIAEKYGNYVQDATIVGISEAGDIDRFCYKVYMDPDTYEIIELEEYGKSWFLTEKEAEEKLRENE